MDNHYCIWQFNFREFSLTDDMYAQACAAGDASPPLAFPPPPSTLALPFFPLTHAGRRLHGRRTR